MCVLKHGHSLVEDSKAQLTKLLPIWTWIKRNGKAFLGNMKGVRVFMGDDQCVCNCSFPLQDAYCLRLLTHRDLLHRLANPPSAEPNRHNRGLGWGGISQRTPLDPSFTLHVPVCLSFFFLFPCVCVCPFFIHCAQSGFLVQSHVSLGTSFQLHNCLK